MTDGSGGPGGSGGLGRASLLLASGTVVSRLLGFLRSFVLAVTIGLYTSGATAFALAIQLPNNIYAIVAGGLLSAVLVPQIVRSARHSDGGQAFVSRLVTLGVVIFAGITLVATLCAPLLVALYASSSGQLEGAGLALATAFAYWCLPQIFFYALYSLLGEVLNARGVFGPFTWAPVLNNVVAIAGIAVFAIVYGVDAATQGVSSWSTGEIVLLAGSATVGVASQALILIAFWRRTGLGFRPDFRWRGVGLGATGRAAGWTFGMILVTQLAGIVQIRVATLADSGDASIPVLNVAWLVFMLPHSIIAVSIATPYFSRMSAHARDRDLAAVRADLSSSLRTIGMLVTGASAALGAAAIPFSAVFSESNRELASTTAVLLAYLVGLVPFSLLFLVQRTFYALGDTRTPFLIQLVQSALFVIGAVAVAALPSPFIAVGIAAVTSAAGIVQALVAAIVLRRRLGGLDGRCVLPRLAWFALAAVPASAAGLAMLAALGGLAPATAVFDLGGAVGDGFAVSSRGAAVLSVAAVGAASAAVYFAGLRVIRAPELAAIVDPIVARFRRRGGE